jgi:addiction module RelE/StbE family toxin
MIRIFYKKTFEKAFSNLTTNQKERVKEAISLFQENPHHPQLKNHALHGSQKNRRAISAGGDLRLIFMEENNYETVVFFRVGTHNQVYKD